jgi:hypothetical protein
MNRPATKQRQAVLPKKALIYANAHKSVLL